MYITKVELENIKSHFKSSYDFQRGTTAIIGSNGAGKTTIIEAVAWTLFDVLDYKKDDFARRGSKKGVVDVTFESSLDEREYIVHRDTGTSYYVYDPKLKMRVADKKDEVRRFLRQHLGVEAGTDLEALYRRAIGVPQGTFTAIFLESAADRKKAFDKLLKVEEYTQSAEKLLETLRFVELQISDSRERIARAEGEISRSKIIETELEEISKISKELKEGLSRSEVELKEKSKNVALFKEKEKVFNELSVSLDKIKAALSAQEILQKQNEEQRDMARAAAEKVKSVRGDYELHVAALGKLQKLESKRKKRDSIKTSLQEFETRISVLKSELKSFDDALKEAREAGNKVSALSEKVVLQEKFEKERDELRGKLAEARAAENQRAGVERELEAQRRKFKLTEEEILRVRKLVNGAGDPNMLSAREMEIVNSLAELRATIERDEKFQREIRNGLCPILTEKCLNLKEGQTLEGFLKMEFTDAKSRIAVLESDRKEVFAQLQAARESEKYSTVLEKLLADKESVTSEGHRLKARAEELEKLAAQISEIQRSYEDCEASLKELDDPRSKKLAYERHAKNKPEIAAKISAGEKELRELVNKKSEIEKELVAFETLDADWNNLIETRDKTSEAHREFIANESVAKLLDETESALAKTTEQLTHLGINLKTIATEFEIAEKSYDRATHDREKFDLREAENRAIEFKTKLAASEKRGNDLLKEQEHLKEIHASMTQEIAEKARLEKVAEATKFIRETLKFAAPRVARNYVFHVSNEANQIFREISGNAERSLKWNEDYSVALEEGGFERPFINLSGGEQMAAALSMRLALLKQLSDIRVAFFDEPTVNMDADNRTRLAEQISQITNFDQLFVISHDDTFESYVDNVVSVG